MASLISRLQKRYIIEGDQLAHDAETCIGELCAALRYTRDALHPVPHQDIIDRIDRALQRCAEGI